MSEQHVDQEDSVLVYVRLKSGDRPFNRYGEGAGFARRAPKEKAATKTRQTYTDNVVDLAAERAKRAKRLK